MQFITKAIISTSALAAFTAAQQVNNVKSSYAAGTTNPVDIVASGQYTLQLRSGDSNNLHNVTYVACGASGTPYSWTVPSGLPSGDGYALEIITNSGINFSNNFTITGGVSGDPAQATLPDAAGCPTSGSTSSSSSTSASSTLSTATSAAQGYVSLISDGQPQAPTGYATPSYTPPKVTPVPGFNSAAAPYVPQAGATGSPAPANSTIPTYSVPSSPTGSRNPGSSNSGASAPNRTSAPASGAASFGSSFALIAGAVAAFVFLN